MARVAPKVSVEIVRAKALPQPEDAFEPLTTAVRLTQIPSLESDSNRCGSGTSGGSVSPQPLTTFTTRTVHRNNDPFFNDVAEFATLWSGDGDGDGAADSALYLDVCVLNMGGGGDNEGVPLGLRGRCAIACQGSGKGEQVVELFPLLRAPSSSSTATAAGAAEKDLRSGLPGMMPTRREGTGEVANGKPMPSVLLRFKVAVPKVKKQEVDHAADIQLPRAPVFNGLRRLVPPDAQYCWWHFFNDAPWVGEFTSVLCATLRAFDAAPSAATLSGTHGTLSLSMTTASSSKKSGRGGSAAGAAAAAEAAATNPQTLTDVLVHRWKCRRTHQVLTKLRICATRFACGQSPVLPLTAEEEHEYKLLLTESAVMREEMISGAGSDAGAVGGGSPMVRERLNRLWMLFAANVPLEGPTPYLNFELSSTLSNAPFGRPQQEVLQSCLLRAVVRGLSRAAADAIAREDCDPSHWDRPLVRPSSAPAVADGDPPAAPSSAATSPLLSKKGRAAAELFQAHVRWFACRLCETLTDCELLSLLDHLVGAVTEARELCKDLPGATGLKIPVRPAGSASQQQQQQQGGRRRRGSARRRSSASTARSRGQRSRSTASTASSPRRGGGGGEGGGGGGGGGVEDATPPSNSSGSPAVSGSVHKLAGPVHIKHLDELGRPVAKA